jgi:HlyD family secretion protein
MFRQTLGAAVAAMMISVAAIAPSTADEPAAASAARPPAISVVTAEIRPVAESLTVTGTLVPREEVHVAADVDGLKIEAVLVDEGDTVMAGQVLARLATDTIDLQLAQNDSQLARADAAIAQARSQIVEVEATLTEADTALQRTRTLVAKGVVSQDVLDRQVAVAAAARARMSAAEQGLSVAMADRRLIEAQRREIELRLAKTEIRAPAAGLVLSRAARVGAMASGQTGALFRIAEDALIELDAEVIETELARVEPGQSVIVANNGGSIVGTVRMVSPEVDRLSRLGHVRVAFPKDARLRAGSFARGEIEVARRDGVTVPVSAVVSSGDSASVQVVKGDTIETRIVRTGLSGGGLVEIIEGLEAGETVVARSGTFLRDGDVIAPVALVIEETRS